MPRTENFAALDGRVAIVTGAGSGIGRAIALRFAKAGAKLVVAELDAGKGSATAASIAEGGGEAFAIQTDVSRPAEVEAMVARARERFSRIDILVNNAGIRPISSILEMPDEDWHRTLAINLNGTFFCLRAVGREMVRQNTGGAIVNLASIVGVRGVRNRAPYGASKAGIINLTQAAALELAPSRIRVNAIAPGFIETPMTEHYLTATDPDTKLIAERALANIPAGRWGQPADVAAAALYLASDEAAYVTGTTLIVDGGVIIG